MIINSARRTGWRFAAIASLAVVGILILAPGPALQVESLAVRAMAPLEAGTTMVVRSVGHLFETIRLAGHLAAQNQTYRQEIDRLQSMEVQLREVELENLDLRRMLGLRARAPLGELISVNVIAQDPVAVVQAVMVDRGSDDGVVVNQPVISWRGIVGRVQEVHPTAAKVLLATDVNSGISGRIQDPDSRATGIVRGTGDGRLLLQYVPRDDVIRVGDTVITSDIGGTFPSGLVMGKITSVRQKDVEAFQEAVVEPSVDMRNLERLYVIGRPADGSAAPRN
jgi:rod shape-determining protein MreC